MDSKIHVFLTIFLTSVVVGFVMVEIHSFNDFENLSTVEDISTGENSVAVATKCFRLDMSISNEKAMLIQSKLDGVESERPLAQEVIGDVSDGSIQRVEITGISDGAYIADLVIDNGLNQRRIDVRPSDAIIVAADKNLPLLIDDDLIRDYGVNGCLYGSVEI